MHEATVHLDRSFYHCWNSALCYCRHTPGTAETGPAGDSQFYEAAGHYDHEEDYYGDDSDEDDDWHEGLAKTPGRRPTSRHVSNGVKNRPDRVVRNGNYQRQQRR